MSMEIRVLGPVAIVHDRDRTVEIPGVKQRTVLAALALEAGQVVPVDRLVEIGWGGQTPRTARRQVMNAVSGLRRLLGPAVVSRPSGYGLDTAVVGVDLSVFEQRLRDARASTSPAVAEDLLRRGLALWSGAAVGGTAGLEPQARRLDDLRVTAVEERAWALSQLGRHADIVDELAPLVDRELHRERLVEALMMALSRIGRSAAALRLYHRVVQTMRTDLGILPGPRLRRCHADVLRATDARI